MKIFYSTLSTFTGSLNTNDAGFVFYYSDMHISEMSNSYVRAFNMHSELSTEKFIDNSSPIAGNNSPLTIVSPEYAPYPYTGNSVIAFIPVADGGLTTAETELEDDFEYVARYDSVSSAVDGYLVWGTFKVTKTDFYTPRIMDTTTYPNIVSLSWNPVAGLDHTSLDYSEKIGKVIDG